MGTTIFKAGTHRTIDGQSIAFSEADLAAIANAYDPAVHEAPVVVGHPKTDDPAMGWVAGLRCVGLRLEADFRQLDPAFAEAVNAGRYKHVSAAFYAPDSPANPKPGAYYLRHVGALGATPPSVKGLGPLAFGEDDTVFLAFGEDDPANPAHHDDDNKDKNPMDKKPEDKKADAAHGSADSPAATANGPVTSGAASGMAAENAALQKQIDDMKTQMAKQEADRRHSDNAAFAEGLVALGKLAPAGRGVVTATLDALTAPKDDGSLIAFGEGEGESPLAEQLRSFLAAAHPQVMFAEFAVNGASEAKESPLIADAKRRAEQNRKGGK